MALNSRFRNSFVVLRRLAIPLVALAVGGCKPKPAAPAAAAPAEVSMAPVIQQDEAIYAEWIGTLDGFVNAQIRAQVSGYLLRQAYQEGQRVRKGDLLFEIDPRPFAAVQAQAKANFDRADLDLKRQSALMDKAVASRQEFETATQQRLAAKAALDQAELNLTFTRILSPVDGVAGIAAAQIGDLVGPGTGVLTTVSTLDPIKVYFSISERSYLDFKKDHATDMHFPEGLELQLFLSDGSEYPMKGSVFAVDRQIEANTGTLRLVGTFPNPDNLLRPGQYARVRAAVRILKNAIQVPQRAITELQGAGQVVVIDAQAVAHVRTVRLGDRVGPNWIVTDGLKAGEHVVVEGLQKVRNGQPVKVVPFNAPAGAAK